MGNNKMEPKKEFIRDEGGNKWEVKFIEPLKHILILYFSMGGYWKSLIINI